MSLNLNLTAEQDRALSAMATKQNLTRQDAAVWAIEEQAARIDTASDVRQWADHALTRYEALLDRLAQ